MIVSGMTGDAVGTRRGNLPGDFGNRREIIGVAVQCGVILCHEQRVGAGASCQIKDTGSFGEVQCRDDGLSNTHGTAMHGERETACAFAVIAEMDLRCFNGLPVANKRGEFSPGRIDIAIVNDGTGKIVGRTLDKGGSGSGRKRVDVVAFCEQTDGNCGI